MYTLYLFISFFIYFNGDIAFASSSSSSRSSLDEEPFNVRFFKSNDRLIIYSLAESLGIAHEEQLTQKQMSLAKDINSFIWKEQDLKTLMERLQVIKTRLEGRLFEEIRSVGDREMHKQQASYILKEMLCLDAITVKIFNPQPFSLYLKFSS